MLRRPLPLLAASWAMAEGGRLRGVEHLGDDHLVVAARALDRDQHGAVGGQWDVLDVMGEGVEVGSGEQAALCLERGARGGGVGDQWHPDAIGDQREIGDAVGA